MSLRNSSTGFAVWKRRIPGDPRVRAGVSMRKLLEADMFSPELGYVERVFTSDSPMLGDTYWLCDLGPVILPQGALLLLSLSGDNPT